MSPFINKLYKHALLIEFIKVVMEVNIFVYATILTHMIRCFRCNYKLFKYLS